MTDYNPKLWGNSGWNFLEYIALGFPNNPTDEDKKQYKALFESLSYTLPCEECKENYKIHFKETSIDYYLKNANTLHHWVITMQNKVNRLKGKKFVNSEKERERKFKHNVSLSSKGPCCGRAKGKEVMTEEQRQKNIEDLQKNRRAKHNLLKISKKNREIRKNKRKGLN